MKKNVLVIGGAGYIGSVLCEALLKNGYSVRCLDLFLYQNHKSIEPLLNHPNFECMTGDFVEPAARRKALEGVSEVVILAGLVGDPITKKYPEESKKINRDGMLDLIADLNGRKLSRVIFVSTCSNYGLIKDNELADENFKLSPLSTYAQAKVEMEKTLLSLKGQVDYEPVILRFATAFGLSPRMRFDLTVNEFTHELARGKELLVYDAHTWRPYCHVKDFAVVIQKAIEARSQDVAFEVFNAGGQANNATKQTILDEIRRRVPGAVVQFKEHGSDPRNYRVDFSKIKSRLGFEPRYTIPMGIEELLAALKAGAFTDTVQNRNFYGNYVIHYKDAYDHIA